MKIKKLYNKAIFLDRDGIINIDKGYVFKKNDFVFIEGIFTLLKYFLIREYILIIITNQSGIARGIYSEKEYIKLTQWILNQFKCRDIDIEQIYHCPHHPEFSGKCVCRKPNPGLILKAIVKYNIDINQSWIIGNKDTDILAGEKAGIRYKVLFDCTNNTSNKESISDPQFYKVNTLYDIMNIHKNIK